MTYKFAKAVQCLVTELNNTWVTDDLQCAIEKTYLLRPNAEYKCMLYSVNDSNYRLIELGALVSAMSTLCNHISYTFGEYNCGTTEEKFVKCIEVY